MNEEFFAEVYQLTVDYPSIDLMKEYSVTAEKNLREHSFYHGVARNASSRNLIEELPSLEASLFNFIHQTDQCREHL